MMMQEVTNESLIENAPRWKQYCAKWRGKMVNVNQRQSTPQIQSQIKEGKKKERTTAKPNRRSLY